MRQLRFGLFILQNRSDWIRDCYIFLPVSLCEVLYEDVLEHVFVGQLFSMQNDIEVDGGISEGVKEYLRLSDGFAGVSDDLLHGVPGNLEGDSLHLLKVAVVAYADGNHNRQMGAW